MVSDWPRFCISKTVTRLTAWHRNDPPTLQPQSSNRSQTFILNWLQDFPFLSFPFINFSFIFALHGELSKLEESSIKNNKRKIEIKNFPFAMKICENISSSFRKTKEKFDSKVNKNNSETRSFQNVAKKLNRSKENKIVDETRVLKAFCCRTKALIISSRNITPWRGTQSNKLESLNFG